ncbi:MAG: phosphoribosylanthranilate isomerase [Rhizobiaceae bacterium]
MALDVKICGLKTEETIGAALDGGATHCGFIFFEKSPRHLEIAQAETLRPAIDGRAQLVAVTVDADDRYLDEIVARVRPDMLQLHGAETPERVAELKTRHRLPVMKALAIREAGDIAKIDAWREVADRLLFDAKPPKGSDVPGGHGVAFDWSLLEALDDDVDYMLSGGLNAANIAEALARTRPTGIDASSGVETAPGVKDTGLIAAFFEALGRARPADR